MAGLKVCQSLLGSSLLPVPSVYLSGLTNMPGIVRRIPPFQDMLRSSLEILHQQQEPFVLFVGYLGNGQQAKFISNCIDQYRSLIHAVIVDPVSGDHGKQYVPDEVLAAWPQILQHADIVLPNYTELKLLCGSQANRDITIAPLLQSFASRFPEATLLVTSVPQTEQDEIGLLLWSKKLAKTFSHPKIHSNYSGSGDAFSSAFIHYRFLQNNSAEDAMRKAAETCLKLIQKSIDVGSDELQIGMF